MAKEHEYFIPTPFASFACKMGECRKPCCEGWPITISLDDYFRLGSCECSEELRHRLDVGVKVSLSPTPDAYAQIVPRYDGVCPLHMEDGRCAIHAELGEGYLSHVCRLYPRSVRTKPEAECAFANSCEAVCELLFKQVAPLEFTRLLLPLTPPPMADREYPFPTMGKEKEIRLWLIGIMQNRSLGIADRLIDLGLALKELEPIIKGQDVEGLNALLKQKSFIPPRQLEVSELHLKSGIEMMSALLAILDKRSESICKYGEEALEYFGNSNDVLADYRIAKESFEKLFPTWQIWLEQLLVNHMFFARFPFQDRPESPWTEFVAICAVYGLLRFLSLGVSHGDKKETDFTDMCAAVFRLVEHTDFDRYAAHTLHYLGCTTPQSVFNFISL